MKRLAYIAGMVLCMFVLLCLPAPVRASGSVKATYQGKEKTYRGKITKVYINGRTKYLSTAPVFMKSGTYMGPLAQLFVNSSFNMKCEKKGDMVSLTYRGKKLVIKDGSRNIILNGEKKTHVLGSAPMQDFVYAGSNTPRWIVPVKSICSRLGINYRMADGNMYLEDEELAASGELESVTPNEKFVLVIDPGHGGIDGGAFGKHYKEKNLNLAICLAAKKYFDKDKRIKVYYTRVSDLYPSLEDRCRLANDHNADLFLCVHINSGGKTSTGTETLFNNARNNLTMKNGITSKRFAAAMQLAACRATGFKNRGLTARKDLWVLNSTCMPACLIEYGFISNPKEERIMHANTSRYGRRLYRSVMSYLENQGMVE